MADQRGGIVGQVCPNWDLRRAEESQGKSKTNLQCFYLKSKVILLVCDCEEHIMSASRLPAELVA